MCDYAWVCNRPELGFKEGIIVPEDTSISRVVKQEEEYREGYRERRPL